MDLAPPLTASARNSFVHCRGAHVLFRVNNLTNYRSVDGNRFSGPVIDSSDFTTGMAPTLAHC